MLVIINLASCGSLYDSTYPKPDLVDKKLTKSTKILHKKLHLIAKEGFAVGQQDATSYGIGWVKKENSNIWRSDFHDVTGKFPLVYGFDIGDVEFGNKNENLDKVHFVVMRGLIIEAHKNGGIITISWHTNNPLNNRNSWDTTPVVEDIINKGSLSNKYKLWLKNVSTFLKSLKYKGKLIPIVFRPYHEMNGSWFWWGGDNCTPEDYKELWRETVVALRDDFKVHNLLYTYSPNKLNDNADYLKYYPGDDYVDIFGVDIYDFKNSEDYIKSLKNDISFMKEVAASKNKLYAFTETGLEAIPTSNWFTEVLYPNIENTGISWILFWRNSTKKHHYVPYKFHENEEDFKAFSELPKALFLNDHQTLIPKL